MAGYGGQACSHRGVGSGRVIASILEHPAVHAGQIYRLCGPKEYTFPEAFEKIAQILRRNITYEKVSYDEFYAQMEKWRGPFFVQHIVEVMKDYEVGVLWHI
jgi:NAD(P)H dehydrogenase (quinone)